MIKIFLGLSALLMIISGCGIKANNGLCTQSSRVINYTTTKNQEVRQSVKLSLSEREFIFQGVTVSEQEKNYLRVIALTGFGIKLFETEFLGSDKISSYINAALGNIPYFRAEAELAIRRLYIEPFCGTKKQTEEGELYTAKEWFAKIYASGDGRYRIDYTSIKPHFKISIADIE